MKYYKTVAIHKDSSILNDQLEKVKVPRGTISSIYKYDGLCLYTYGLNRERSDRYDNAEGIKDILTGNQWWKVVRISEKTFNRLLVTASL